MNNLKLLFALSAALNVGLVTLLAFFIASSPSSTADRSPKKVPTQNIDWSASASGDSENESVAATLSAYRPLYRALHATGMPEREIQRILRGAAIADLQADIRRLQRDDDASDAFWESHWQAGPNLETSRTFVEIRREREAALAELFGDRDAADLSTGFIFDRAWSGIPADKQRRVRMLEEDYRLLMAEVRGDSGSAPSEDREVLQLLDQERRDDLASILSPEEMEEYELRHSNVSQALRRHLRYFDTTEDEFRDIFALRRAIISDLPDGVNDLQLSREDVFKEAMEDGLRDLLGEERFAEYRRASDPDFQQLASLTDRLNLPRERAIEVYNFKELIDEQQQALENDDALSREDRREATHLLAEDAHQMVLETLGERGYEAYTETAGWWLHRLERETPLPDDPEDEPREEPDTNS